VTKNNDGWVNNRNRERLSRRETHERGRACRSVKGVIGWFMINRERVKKKNTVKVKK